MKKKLSIGVLVLIALLVVGYFYVYKEHRNIAAEEESYTVSVATVFSEFQENEFNANKKFLDKTIVVSGEVSSINTESQSIVLDEKLFAVFSEKIPSDLEIKSVVKIKGRLIGYDSLLEQIKMDQCSIIN